MSDTLMTIIGIFLAVILMFVFPLMEIAGKNDEMSQTVAQVAVSDFVNKVASTGKITEFDYNELIQKLYATGNSYDIQIEAKIIDDNPRRATTTTSSGLLGEYKYYSVYTNTILEKIRDNAIKNGEGTGEYVLKKDDYIIVTVKNTNITIGTQLKNLMYKLIGKDTYTIGTSASALVLNSGTDEVAYGDPMTENSLSYSEKVVTLNVQELTTITTTHKSSSLLKVTLNNLDINNGIAIGIEINGNSQYYVLGSNLPSYIVYKEGTEYVLDLLILRELLSLTEDEWNNANISVSYKKL